MAKLIGTNPNQVPTNADLGTMAYQDYGVVAPELKSGRRNLLINSLFNINQRNTTTTSNLSGNQAFTADRWKAYTSGVSNTVTIQEVTLPDGTVTNSHKTTATSTANNAFFHPYQKIEAYGKDYLQGKTIVMSTWIRTNVAGQRMRICDTVNCHLIGDEIPSDGQWHFVQATHVMPTSMNTGVSNDIQFQPQFGIVTINSGDYVEFALPQFELGSVATPHDFRSYGEELALCKRYYEEIGRSDVAFERFGVGWTNTTGSSFFVQFDVEKRVNPSVSISDVGHFYTYTYEGNKTATTAQQVDLTPRGYNQNFSGITANNGDGALMIRDGSDPARIYVDAEL